MEWVRGEEIGCGSFATVNLATQKTRSHQVPQLFAVKSCPSSQSDMLSKEKLILEELKDCPQIIQCYGDDESVEKGEILYNVFLEYASGGTLADKVRSTGEGRLPEYEVRRYTKSVLEGLQYIHKSGFVHCDIKLQNILLRSSNDGRNNDAKIADFGLAKRAGEKREKAGVELRGTPLYMSPEVVNEGEQEAPADVWALGCLIAEMITGAPVWRSLPKTNIFRLLMRIGSGDESPEIPESLSAEGKDFLEKCFAKDPTKRWTAEMLLNHPFIVGQSDVQFCEASPSTSPRGPLDWSDRDLVESSRAITNLRLPEHTWESSTWSPRELNSCTGPSSDTSAAKRLRQLVTDQELNSSVSDSWINVR